MDGVLNVYKHPGPTSHDIVEMARKALGNRKIGHAGTLDPLAEGVLLLCIGKGTRLSEYLADLPKEYLAEITFGITTSTYDAEGEIISRSDKKVSEEDVRSIMKQFIGEIEQVPPPSSAIRHKGKKLYEWAREGTVIELPPRKVTIYELILEHFDPEKNKALFRVSCSKGTYIRALARDMGEKIGIGAYLSQLKRTSVGPFKSEEAYPAVLLKRENKEEIEQRIIPLIEALPHFPLFIVDNRQALKLSSGVLLPLQKSVFPVGKYIRVASMNRQLICIGKVIVKDGQTYLKPEKVFGYE
ncbi:tRNA pseudouridine(55) synthase TruB [bacterium]|nr:tRNA pseudouridine(55) synthase TruB [bacterium]